MAKVTGKNSSVNFASTVYACLTDLNITGTSNVVETECSTDGTGNATVNKVAGAPSWTVQTTMLLEGSASTVPNALDIGDSGALKAYPEGDESGTLEYSWTTAEVSDHTVTSSTSTHMALDVTFACTGNPTIGTTT